jgi:hypothetical protein
MLKVLLLLTFCSDLSETCVQETIATESKKLHQLYLGFGTGPTQTFAPDLAKHGLTFFSHVNISFHKSIFFRGGIYYTPYSDNLRRYKSLGNFDNQEPIHEIYSYYLSVGKRKQLNRFLIIQATAGISFNRHFQPDNVHLEYGYAFFNRNTLLNYDIKVVRKPGFIIQAEIISSLGLGTYYHYIPQASNAGLTISLNLGLIARKQKSVKQT